MHLAHDVAAADELAVDEDLRDGRPVAVALDRVAQRAVDRLMALGQALALETLAYHQRLEMVAAASEVAHLNMRARQPALDHCLYLLRFHQSSILARQARRIPPARRRNAVSQYDS